MYRVWVRPGDKGCWCSSGDEVGGTPAQEKAVTFPAPFQCLRRLPDPADCRALPGKPWEGAPGGSRSGSGWGSGGWGVRGWAQPQLRHATSSPALGNQAECLPMP